MARWDGIDEFIAVGETESFSRAARRLGISTSHVSRAVARLEDRLQVRLLYRTTRHVSLTDAGSTFLERCRRLVDEREDMYAAVSEQDGAPKGHLRLTCSIAYGERYIVPLVNRFAASHPQLAVTIDLSNRVVDLVGEGFDLAVRTGNLHDSRLIATRLASRTRHLCAAPGYIDRHGTPRSLEDLARHHCLVGTTDVWQFSVDGREVDIRPQGNWRCNSGFAVVDAALQGLGICQLPDFYVTAHLAEGRLVPLLDHLRPPDEGVWAVYPHRRHLSPKVSLLIEYLRTRLEDAPAASSPNAGRDGGASHRYGIT
ncbi:LysR family transcriptional regulator [Nitrospirillum sp. BR 11164]|uniref:LysR family transcriptional regulator n=1 Tax=Nitrospirillum sp. BR 11164 TaxID=3104324 RepID=UPI002AFF056D|nr:LysR family transcriptional regulator [Nitrospirillum sp. BR 11164]MEA1652100.1 LysR family transcriptional regulator [Nitrospirillum sp. BR 11164]